MTRQGVTRHELFDLVNPVSGIGRARATTAQRLILRLTEAKSRLCLAAVFGLE